MKSSLTTIPSQATVLEAAQKLQESNTNALAVTVRRKVCGFVTDHDVVRSLVAEDESEGSERKVQEIMTTEVAACYQDADVKKAARFVKKKGIHHLLVFDRQKKLVGFVSAPALM
jgi:IMP dehydrogenase